MHEAQDEISLRELYLIFRGGLRWIVGLSVGVALVTFAVMTLLPRRYQATATVRISPLQVQGQSPQNGQDIIDVNSVTQIGFDAYRTIALSHGVLAGAVKATSRLPSTFGAKQLAEATTVTKVSGGGSDPLIVSQTVSAANAQQAATLANAWASASADAARASIGKALGSLRSTLTTQVSSLADVLNQTESAWASFQKQDDRSSLQAQLASLDSRTTTAHETLDRLDRSIATAKARQSVYKAVIDARSQGNPADLSAQLQALTDQGVLTAQMAQQLTTAIASAPGAPGAANQDLATLVARAQLQQEAADLAGYVAERQTLTQQLAGFSTQASDLRGQLATQQQTAQQLQRQLTSAQSAYDQVAQTAPLIDVADKLVPSMAGVFNEASVPQTPIGRRTSLVTVVVFVLAFFGTALFVFLRAIVTEDVGVGGRGRNAPEGTQGRERSDAASDVGVGPRAQRAVADAVASTSRPRESEAGRHARAVDANHGEP